MEYNRSQLLIKAARPAYIKQNFNKLKHEYIITPISNNPENLQ